MKSEIRRFRRRYEWKRLYPSCILTLFLTIFPDTVNFCLKYLFNILFLFFTRFKLIVGEGGREREKELYEIVPFLHRKLTKF